jgi:putative toxin-antitoxin system antitoxin component (TIGR02293 family)
MEPVGSEEYGVNETESTSPEQLWEIARRVFGSDAAAKEWFALPAIALDRQVPEDLLATEPGRKLVHTLLVQLDYCVYV